MSSAAQNVRVVGRYALYQAIAAGGMATVHLGRLLGPVGFSRTVAIKRLHAQFASDPEFVSMFLEPGDNIVTVRTRDRPDEVINATKPREFTPAAIICLQDNGTASAAELVIAALVNSKTARAASQGPKTHGKGVVQTPIELRGGGKLDITSGELIAPQGLTWDTTGLLPSVENRGRIFPKD